MNRYLFFLCCFLVLSTLAYSQRCLPLFKHKDLSGWKINGTEKWYVENGELIAESGPDKEYGYLVCLKDELIGKGEKEKELLPCRSIPVEVLK